MSKKSTKDRIRDLANEIDVFDDMLTSLVEVLEEKGILTQEEWEKRIKEKIEERKKFLRAIAPDVKVTNLTEKDEEPPLKALTETEKQICKQLNLTEEQFRSGRGEKLQEAKPKSEFEKLQEQIDELKKKGV